MKDVIADALLYIIIIVLAATAGMQYQAHRHAQADKAELQDLQRRAAANAAWLRSERKASEERLNQHIAKLYTQLSQAQGKANEDHQAHVAGLRAGTVSVRVPIVPASCTSDSVRPAGNAAAAAAATHAQLDPAAAADLAAIPHEGDAAIRERNACIAQYNAVKEQMDEWRSTLLHMEAGHAQAH